MGSDSLRPYLERLQDEFRMNSGCLQRALRTLREHSEGTQRILREHSKSNQTSSYRRSQKNFVLFFEGVPNRDVLNKEMLAAAGEGKHRLVCDLITTWRLGVLRRDMRVW